MGVLGLEALMPSKLLVLPRFFRQYGSPMIKHMPTMRIYYFFSGRKALY